jgi:hypothetical protein
MGKEDKLQTICENFSTLLGKDAILRLIVACSILLEGSFSLAADSALQNVPHHVQLLRVYFSLETMAYVTRASHVIAKSFGTSRLCLRFTEDIPAIYALWKYFSRQAKSPAKGGKNSRRKKVIAKFS